jgi:hypothetical protein
MPPPDKEIIPHSHFNFEPSPQNMSNHPRARCEYGIWSGIRQLAFQFFDFQSQRFHGVRIVGAFS